MVDFVAVSDKSTEILANKSLAIVTSRLARSVDVDKMGENTRPTRNAVRVCRAFAPQPEVFPTDIWVFRGGIPPSQSTSTAHVKSRNEPTFKSTT